MPPRRLHQTLADYIVIAISPALIMALVGSLVFFLLRVFYQGEFQERLHWVMACFVFAAVLIARISIESGFERAAPFGAALALVLGFAAHQFMEFDGTWIDNYSWILNFALIGVVWWCVHQLTWDCTVIDDDQDSSGEGLMQVVGLEATGDSRNSAADERRLEGTTSREVPTSYWQRYLQHQRRPHAPGVWVVYFSLAAAPIFGVGQWFIPASDVSGRRYVFSLLTVYVACGLGLLLTTSFLGLRRYLRQRRIEMPTLMANLWLTTGGIIIAALLAAAAILPRPSAEYAVARLPFSLGSPKQDASDTAPLKRDGTRDDQSATAASDESQASGDEPPPGVGNQPSGLSASDSGAKGDSSSESQGATQEQGDSQSQSGDQQSSGSPSSSGSQGDQKSSGGRQEKSPESSRTGKQSQSKASSTGQKKKPSPLESIKKFREVERELAAKYEDRPKGDKGQESDQKSDPPNIPPEPPQLPQMDQALSPLASLLRWVFYGVVAAVALLAVWWYWRDVLAAIRGFFAELAAWWRSLWGGKRDVGMAEEVVLDVRIPPPPFASFADPFATGLAADMPIERLVSYSFDAFEAWARDHGCPREADQTPHELARDVARLNASMVVEARNLADLYCRAAFAKGRLPESAEDQLRSLWRKMNRPQGVVS